jgi:hypothetical protein
LVSVAFWLVALQASPLRPPASARTSVDPIQVVSPGAQRSVVRKADGTTVSVRLLDPGTELQVRVVGPGELAITLQQLLPADTPITDRATFGLAIDDEPIRDIDVVGRASKTGTLADRPGWRLSVARRLVQTVGRGRHTLGISAPRLGGGGAVQLEWLEGTASTGGRPAEEPTVVAPPLDLTPPLSGSQAGRDRPELALFSEVMVVDRITGEEYRFYRVPESQPYIINVPRPGVVTVRLHRLLDVDRAVANQGAPYSVVILENGRILQQVGGSTRTSSDWRIGAGEGTGPLLLAEPREYRLTVSAPHRQLAVQIGKAAEGMVVSASYEADDETPREAPPNDDTGSTTDLSRPTAVLEVDVRDRPSRDAGGLLGGAITAGAFLPAAGGVPGTWAGARLAAGTTLFGRRFALGAQASVLRHTMTANAAGPYLVPIHLSSNVVAVPLLATLSVRQPIGRSSWAAIVRVGGGTCYIYANRSALDAETAASRWRWAVAGAAGPAMRVGPGWLALEAGYLYVPTSDLGILRRYTPRAPTLAVAYSLGI